MTIANILEQAKKLSQEELDILVEELRMMQHTSQTEEIKAHWGKSLNTLLDDIGTIEMKYQDIEDPVAWLKHLRAENRQHRLGDGLEEE